MHYFPFSVMFIWLDRLRFVLLLLILVVIPVLEKGLGMEIRCVIFWLGFKAFNCYCETFKSSFSSLLHEIWLDHLLELPND